MAVFAHLIPEGLEQRLSDDAEKRLRELVQKQTPEGVSVEFAVRHGSIHHQILQYCGDVQANLIIMSAHKTEFKDYVLGPNAAHVVRHAQCSVWMIRQ